MTQGPQQQPLTPAQMAYVQEQQRKIRDSGMYDNAPRLHPLYPLDKLGLGRWGLSRQLRRGIRVLLAVIFSAAAVVWAVAALAGYHHDPAGNGTVAVVLAAVAWLLWRRPRRDRRARAANSGGEDG